MNYSKSMKVNVKRFFTSWIISLIITSVISSSVTTLLVKPDLVEAVHHHEWTKVYFFNPKVQVPEVCVEEVKDIEPLIYSLGEYTITAYCSCEICCGEWAKNRPDGIVYGAAMVELQPGISIAAPREFDFGTQIIIDGVEYVVQDRLANWVVERYEGKIIDIYFDDHQAALEFGKQVKEIYMKGEAEMVKCPYDTCISNLDSCCIRTDIVLELADDEETERLICASYQREERKVVQND